MAIICPTVLASDPHDYRNQMDRVSFAPRIQIDLMDGDFTPTHSVNPIQAWWPDGMQADIHLMFRRPLDHVETLVAAQPHLVIIHAEAEGDLLGFMEHMQKFGIKAGIALLKDTPVEAHEDLIVTADHVLLFSGDLGRFGGVADLRVLDKVGSIRRLNREAEIGWDGGANEKTVHELADGGIDVINVGSAIQKSAHPQEAYDTLVTSISSS